MPAEKDQRCERGGGCVQRVAEIDHDRVGIIVTHRGVGNAADSGMSKPFHRRTNGKFLNEHGPLPSNKGAATADNRNQLLPNRSVSQNSRGIRLAVGSKLADSTDFITALRTCWKSDGFVDPPGATGERSSTGLPSLT